jgi:hypothetical protein
MNRKISLVIGVFLFLAVSFAVVGYYCYGNSQVDTSWIDNVNTYLEESKPYPDASANNYYLLSSYQLYLEQNGTTQLILWATQSNNFYSYLKDIILQVNQQRNASINQEGLNQILSSSKVIFLDYRFPEDIGFFTDITNAYFILESNLDKELQGTIIIKQTNGNDCIVSSWIIRGKM